MSEMQKIHLSPAQRAAILAVIARYSERPSPADYDREQRSLGRIEITPKPKAKSIPNTLPGFQSGDVKLGAAFDAKRDLPEGWAAVSCHDSGGNHSIENAATCVWRNVWNGWIDGAPYDLAAKAAAPGGAGETVRALTD
jgi:hypothetical protein